MFSSNFLLILSAVVSSVNCKKYDVYAECIKMYGEDLKTVVQRFRRTPAYLSILESRVNKLDLELNDIILQEYSWYQENKLPEKILDKFPQLITPANSSTTERGEDRRLYQYKRILQYNEVPDNDKMYSLPFDIKKSSIGIRRMRKSEADGTSTTRQRQKVANEDTLCYGNQARTSQTWKYSQTGHFINNKILTLPSMATPRRRDNEETNCSTTTISPVEILDEYKIKKDDLSADMINEARNIGFEAIGDVIHNVIKDMGGAAQDEVYSTKQPGGGGERAKNHATKTTHVTKHRAQEKSEEEKKTSAVDHQGASKKDDTRY